MRAWLFCRRLAHISPGRRWRFKSQGLHVHNINEHYSNRSRTMPKLFKDPGGTICLPPAVQSRVVSWKRPTEITADPEPPPWVMVSPKRFETVPQFHIQSESEKTFLRAKKMRVKPKLLVSRRRLHVVHRHIIRSRCTQEAHSGFIGPNEHMFGSDVCCITTFIALVYLTPLHRSLCGSTRPCCAT